MTTLDHDGEVVLAQSRRALAPSAAVKARVLLATRAAIAGAVPAPTSAGSPGETVDRLREWYERTAASSGAWVSKGLIGAALAASGFGTGYWAGQRSIPEPTSVVTGTRAQPGMVAPPVTRPEVVVANEAAPRTPERPASAVRVPKASTSATAEASLDEEIRTLRRVERALREHNARLARALLDELDHNAPRGKLVEERHAARAMADCELAPDNGVDVASDFARRFPNSVYLSRVEQTCTPEPHSK